MPELPKGEHALQEAASRFIEAGGFIIAMLAQAAIGDRARALRLALEQLTALRLRNYRPLVAEAYLTVHPNGKPDAVKDLASSLTKKLDTGIIVASDSARQTFKRVTLDTIDDATTAAVVAHIDKAGHRWGLGDYATMTCTTIGRAASSRGVTDRIGNGNTVTIEVSGCPYCETFAGEAVIGTDALPPYHPGCRCRIAESLTSDTPETAG